MNKEIKENLHFVEVFNKVKVESIKADHPSAETIYLYAKRALSDENLMALADHVENCWQCGEILSDAEEFQQISADVDAGILSASVKMPRYASPKEKQGIPTDPDQAKGKPIGTSAPSLWDWLNSLAPAPQVAYCDTDSTFITTIHWRDAENDHESELTFIEVMGGIEVYTPDEALVGKWITVTIGDAVVKGKFHAETVEDAQARAFLRIVGPQIFDQIKGANALSLEINWQ